MLRQHRRRSFEAVKLGATSEKHGGEYDWQARRRKSFGADSIDENLPFDGSHLEARRDGTNEDAGLDLDAGSDPDEDDVDEAGGEKTERAPSSSSDSWSDKRSSQDDDGRDLARDEYLLSMLRDITVSRALALDDGLNNDLNHNSNEEWPRYKPKYNRELIKSKCIS